MNTAPASLKSRRQQAADWYALAEQLREADPLGAEDAYRKALRIAPEPHFLAYANLGALLSGDDARCTEALSVFEEALSHFEHADLLHYNRAVLLEQMGRLEEAAESYLHCVARNPRNEEAVFNRGAVLEELGRIDDAAGAYMQCLQIDPHHDEARRHLDRLIDKLGDDTQALFRRLSAWRRAHS